MLRYTTLLVALLLSLVCAPGLVADGDVPDRLETLGERLFFDVNLSANRSQSCASCHDPSTGFADPRGMASPGDDGVSLGDRNAPTAAYAKFSPAFHRNEEGAWIGGQFLDGTAATLEDQAGGPPLNPIEMGMPDKAAVVARLKQDPVYPHAFPALFGNGVLEDTEAAYAAMTKAIAAFERTDLFSPFDSKYDRYLKGETHLTPEEQLGRRLFFFDRLTNCTQCHQMGKSMDDPRETFTYYRYHNIGVPENRALRALNGVKPGKIDPGLGGNPNVEKGIKHIGKFRTPTLRNVAVTGPYMHNGVFADLRTVVLFYNQFNTQDPKRRTNPETGKSFRMPQMPMTLAVKELTFGPELTDEQIDALVAFLKTLTDARYEHLLEE